MNVTWNGVQLLDLSGPAKKKHMIHLSTQSRHKIEHNLRTSIKQFVDTIRPSILIVIFEYQNSVVTFCRHTKGISRNHISIIAQLKLPHPKICPSSKLFRSKTRTIGDWEVGSPPPIGTIMDERSPNWTKKNILLVDGSFRNPAFTSWGW